MTEHSISDDDIQPVDPTEDDQNVDTGERHGGDTGDEPTERDEDLDVGGEGERDSGDEVLLTHPVGRGVAGRRGVGRQGRR